MKKYKLRVIKSINSQNSRKRIETPSNHCMRFFFFFKLLFIFYFAAKQKKKCEKKKNEIQNFLC